MLHKRIKRGLAALAAGAVFLSCLAGMPAFAAQPVPYSRTVDFSTLEDDNENSLMIDGGWNAVDMRQAAEGSAYGSYKYRAVSGAFGRTADDKSLCIYNDSTVTEPADTDPMQRIAFMDATGTYDGVTTDGADNRVEVAQGQYYELSFDLAVDSEDGHKEIRAYYMDPQSSDGMSQIVTITKGGSVNIFGEPIGLTMGKGRWYNFRFIFKSGDNNAANDADKNQIWLYVNNQLIKSDVFVPTARKGTGTEEVFQTFKGFDRIWFCQEAWDGGRSTEAAVHPTRMLYVDNFTVASMAEEPEMPLASRTVDYSNISAEDTVNSLKANRGLWQSVEPKVQFPTYQYGVADGVYGRAADDRSVRLYNDPSLIDPSAHDITQFIRYADTSKAMQLSIQEGEFFELEIYMASPDYDNFRGIEAFYIKDDTAYPGGDGKASRQLLSVNSGILRVLGTEVPDISIQPNKWYKFNLVIHAGDDAAELDADKNYYKLYVDDRLVKDQTVFQPLGRTTAGAATNIGKFMGFHTFWLYQQIGATADSTERNIYFDDFTVANRGTTEPVYTPVTLTSGNAVMQRYKTGELLYWFDDSIKADDSWTATGSEGEQIQITLRDETGAELQDGAPLGDRAYIEMTRENGSALYATLEKYDKTLRNITFPAETYAETPDGEKCTELNYAVKDFTTERYEDGLAGRADGDYSLTMATEQTTGANDSAAPFVQLYTDDSQFGIGVNTVRPFHTEVSIRAAGDFKQMDFQFVSKAVGGKDERPNAVVITPQGEVKDKEGTVVGRYQMGEWIRIGVSVYPATNELVLRLDGKTVSVQPMFSDPSMQVARFKVEQIFDCSETNPKSGEFSIDDFAVYQGGQREADYNGIQLDSADCQVYNEGRVIFIPYAMDQMEFYAALSGFSTDVPPTIFKDGTLQEELGAEDMIQTGNVLTVSDGTNYNYYWIAEGSPAQAMVAALNDAEGNPLTLTGGQTVSVNASLAFFRPAEKAAVVLAQYDENGALVSFGYAGRATDMYFPGAELSEEPVYPVVMGGWTFDFAVQDVSGSSIRAFLLDDLGTLTPLGEAMTVR